jgi:hypothetical protein
MICRSLETQLAWAFADVILAAPASAVGAQETRRHGAVAAQMDSGLPLRAAASGIALTHLVSTGTGKLPCAIANSQAMQEAAHFPWNGKTAEFIRNQAAHFNSIDEDLAIPMDSFRRPAEQMTAPGVLDEMQDTEQFVEIGTRGRSSSRADKFRSAEISC